MLNEGATIIDIGAYSSRPGSKHITEEEEEKRLIKNIKLIKSEFSNIIISIDTFRSKIAQKAIEAGGNIINDISGGELDKKMFRVVKEFKVPYVLMHMKGVPSNMQKNPTYKNITNEVSCFFNKKIKKLNTMGVKNIILDPGFGFGKNIKHNYKLLNELSKIQKYNLPILVGFSRKSMISRIINSTPKNSLNGTTVLNTIALQKGANILRVHDVKEANEAIKIYTFAKKNK